MAKSNNIFLCDNCGNEFSKWVGQCPACGSWNSLKEVSGLIKPHKNASPRSRKITASSPKEALSNSKKLYWSTGIAEFDRVLGQGLVAGGVYLLAGEPGIGKSTLLTQLTTQISVLKHGSVVYICSEESPSQVASRIARLSATKYDNEQIILLGTNQLEEILNYLAKPELKIAMVIVDSIQTMQTEQVAGQAGTPTQIRACSNLLIQYAKESQTPVILVGHVTKTGTLAGPKLLEHMVDVVLQLEGDRHYDLRLLRGIKNRFGPTDETGLFQMTSLGLIDIQDPNSIFLTSKANGPGTAVCLVMEGTRPLTVEIQALTVRSELAIPRRIAQGIALARLQLICAILTKHKHLNLGQYDVFVNVTSGLSVREPAADLAIALAIYSSLKDKPLPEKTICLGELGLLGEIRPVPYLDKRLKQAKKLGYKHFYTPEDNHINEIRL